MSLNEISDEIKRLSMNAKVNKLTTYDVSNGTFTLSNIGSIGGIYATPIIFSPQVAIGAVGQVSDDCKIHISWAGDHRVIDGATMARFSNKVKQYIEHPISML